MKIVPSRAIAARIGVDRPVNVRSNDPKRNGFTGCTVCASKGKPTSSAQIIFTMNQRVTTP